MEDQIPYGYVYRIVNKVNGKTYIGQHKLKNESWRSYMGSGVVIARAIDKYGSDNFIKQLVCFSSTPQKLSDDEKKEISLEITKGRSEYNVSHNLNNKSRIFEVDNEYLIDLYVNKKLSYSKIARITGISVPSLNKRISKIVPNYEEVVKEHRDLYRKNADYSKFQKAGFEKSSKKVKCRFCSREILVRSVDRHERVHLEGSKTKATEDGKCLFKDCLEETSTNRSKYCLSHRGYRKPRESKSNIKEKVSKDVFNKIVDLHKLGLTVEQIASKTSVTRGIVLRVLISNGSINGV